ncbi:MAG: prepilin-type N-terminal cleavage/methylation domain-containing protein [Gemmataceae bacterium]|jgi:type II secretory pathway pseudopilin PulG|nr:prepilin-type N-terminal cleavage/methylation domain-containing protein [Gemmataceae bacterium]
MLIHRSKRTGFTLVELLVAIGIAIVLAGLAALTFPNFRQSTAVTNSVNQLQATLSVAKQRAIRDKLPRGVRLIYTGDPFVTELQFIEQPEPIVPPVGSSLVIPNGTEESWTATINFPSAAHAADVHGLLSTTAQGEDVLEIEDFGGFVGRIVSAPTLSGATISFDVRDKFPARQGSGGFTLFEGFRIRRSPKPLVGEPNVMMSKAGVLIANSKGIALNTANNGFDIMFNANGEVSHAVVGQIHLWVAPLTGNAQPSILCLYTKSGYMAVYDIAPGSDPYAYSRDGRGPSN